MTPNDHLIHRIITVESGGYRNDRYDGQNYHQEWNEIKCRYTQ